MENEQQQKPFAIICVKAYEFEGTQLNVGDISYHSFGRNIPKNWRKATDKELKDYVTQPPSTSGDKNLTAMGDVLELIELRLEDSDPEYCMGLELIRREIYSQNLLAKEKQPNV